MIGSFSDTAFLFLSALFSATLFYFHHRHDIVFMHPQMSFIMRSFHPFIILLNIFELLSSLLFSSSICVRHTYIQQQTLDESMPNLALPFPSSQASGITRELSLQALIAVPSASQPSANLRYKLRVSVTAGLYLVVPQPTFPGNAATLDISPTFQINGS